MITMAPNALSSMFSFTSPNVTRQLSMDFTACHSWYSYPNPPLDDDCLEAFDVLPKGDDPVSWYTRSIPAGIRGAYELPIIVRHGQYY